MTEREKTNQTLEMRAANLMLDVQVSWNSPAAVLWIVQAREDDLVAAKRRCDTLETVVQEITGQNEQFRSQVTGLTAKE